MLSKIFTITMKRNWFRNRKNQFQKSWFPNRLSEKSKILWMISTLLWIIILQTNRWKKILRFPKVFSKGKKSWKTIYKFSNCILKVNAIKKIKAFNKIFTESITWLIHLIKPKSIYKIFNNCFIKIRKMNKLKEFKILKMRYKKTKMYQIKNKMLQLPQNLILFKIF